MGLHCSEVLSVFVAQRSLDFEIGLVSAYVCSQFLAGAALAQDLSCFASEKESELSVARSVF